MPFLTTIVVPIVGNAAEHASALIFAVKNRMEISLGVAIGKHLFCVSRLIRMSLWMQIMHR
jgi:Ca2+:H+ antiporter